MLVTLLVLVLLLRAVVAPLILIATVIDSFAATIGLSAIVFYTILGLPGADPSVPLLAFVFLAALGVDYPIFRWRGSGNGVSGPGRRTAPAAGRGRPRQGR